MMENDKHEEGSGLTVLIPICLVFYLVKTP